MGAPEIDFYRAEDGRVLEIVVGRPLSDMSVEAALQASHAAMICIWCFEDKPPSREDVFQTAIGGTFRIERVCKNCKNFGHGVDHLLTDRPLIVMMRERFGVAGKRGHIPKLLREGTMEVADGHGGIRDVKVHKTAAETGALYPQIIPKIEARDSRRIASRYHSHNRIDGAWRLRLPPIRHPYTDQVPHPLRMLASVRGARLTQRGTGRPQSPAKPSEPSEPPEPQRGRSVAIP